MGNLQTGWFGGPAYRLFILFVLDRDSFKAMSTALARAIKSPTLGILPILTTGKVHHW